jgi:hypothetical protein
MSPNVAVMVAGLPPGVRMEQVSAAVDVLCDPALPGVPWSAEEIAEVLPLLAEMAGDGSMAAPATTLRWLDAIDAGAALPEE